MARQSSVSVCVRVCVCVSESLGVGGLGSCVRVCVCSLVFFWRSHEGDML